jgi:hypothetical protein
MIGLAIALSRNGARVVCRKDFLLQVTFAPLSHSGSQRTALPFSFRYNASYAMKRGEYTSTLRLIP